MTLTSSVGAEECGAARQIGLPAAPGALTTAVCSRGHRSFSDDLAPSFWGGELRTCLRPRQLEWPVGKQRGGLQGLEGRDRTGRLVAGGYGGTRTVGEVGKAKHSAWGEGSPFHS